MNEPLILKITLNEIDEEIDCMDALRQVMNRFQFLEGDQRSRVCDWFYDRYRVKVEL